jgi:hypothetical protein
MPPVRFEDVPLLGGFSSFAFDDRRRRPLTVLYGWLLLLIESCKLQHSNQAFCMNCGISWATAISVAYLIAKTIPIGRRERPLEDAHEVQW